MVAGGVVVVRIVVAVRGVVVLLVVVIGQVLVVGLVVAMGTGRGSQVVVRAVVEPAHIHGPARGEGHQRRQGAEAADSSGRDQSHGNPSMGSTGMRRCRLPIRRILTVRSLTPTCRRAASPMPRERPGTGARAGSPWPPPRWRTPPA